MKNAAVVIPKSVVEPATMKDQVYRTLRALILSGKLLPGQPLVEAQIAPQLGTSKTPLREAFLRLEADGLLNLSPRRGARVTRLSLKELADYQYVRLILEVAAFELTAENITPEELARARVHLDDMRARTLEHDWDAYEESHRRFHAGLFEATRNPVLAKALLDLFDRTQRYSRFCLERDTAYWEQDERDHHATLDALERKDVASFDALFRRMNDAFVHYIDQALRHRDDALARFFADLPDGLAEWRASIRARPAHAPGA